MSDKKENNKKYINLKKRGNKTSPLAHVMPSLMAKIGGKASEQKNAASIIRVMDQWATIVGEDIAKKSAPVKIFTKYQKNRKTGEQDKFLALRISVDGAVATALAMREAIIVERLNRLFGHDNMFRKLDIQHGFVSKKEPLKQKTKMKKFDIDVSDIEDPILKSRLESLGQAVMNSAQNKES